jgi:hypothetical protein
MKPLFEHDCTCCTYLGTENDHDLYHCGQSGFGQTVIARYGYGPDYTSGLVFSKTGILRIAAEKAIEKGILSRDDWRKSVYSPYIPYSEVKRLFLLPIEELEELSDMRSYRSGYSLRLLYSILDKRKAS